MPGTPAQASGRYNWAERQDHPVVTSARPGGLVQCAPRLTLEVQDRMKKISLLFLLLPMLATAASTFCMICVSSSCGEAPGWETSTCTPGNEISGLSVRGRRKKATRP